MTKATDHPSAEVRIRVMKRDRFRCTYCGTPGTDTELEVDHIIARSNGGSNHMSNLTTACRDCNQSKGARVAPPRVLPSSAEPRGLIGMFVLEYDPQCDSGRSWKFQYRVIGSDGDLVLVQMFSALTGSATEVRTRKKEFVLSERCRLFSEHAQWLHRADQECRESARRGV